MHLILVGVNHKTASVNIRERLFFAEAQLPQAYAQLSSSANVKACVIVSTCNRTEIYIASPNIEEGYADIEQFIESFHSIERETYFPYAYRKHCEDAVSHLFKVAASLDSMVVGEYQIQGQIRDAYTFAAENGYANGLIHKIFQSAIQVGKVIRSETEISKGSVSIASVAVDLVNDLFRERTSFSLLIIGAGKMAALATEDLSQLKECKVSVCNRTLDKATELAQKFNATIIPYELRYKAICDNDIVIVSTGADDYVLTKEELSEYCSGAFSHQKFFIDISVPRNIDPAINELDNIILYSLDDLQNVITTNLDKRSAEIEKAEHIITTIAGDYYEWYAKQEIMPIMQNIKQELSVIKTRTLLANKAATAQFNNQQQELLNSILDEYSDKLIKVIMKNLKSVAGKDELIKMALSLKNTFTVDEV